MSILTGCFGAFRNLDGRGAKRKQSLDLNEKPRLISIGGVWRLRVGRLGDWCDIGRLTPAA
jgi:hypothetical protein